MEEYHICINFLMERKMINGSIEELFFLEVQRHGFRLFRRPTTGSQMCLHDPAQGIPNKIPVKVIAIDRDLKLGDDLQTWVWETTITLKAEGTLQSQRAALEHLTSLNDEQVWTYRSHATEKMLLTFDE